MMAWMLWAAASEDYRAVWINCLAVHELVILLDREVHPASYSAGQAGAAFPVAIKCIFSMLYVSILIFIRRPNEITKWYFVIENVTKFRRDFFSEYFMFFVKAFNERIEIFSVIFRENQRKIQCLTIILQKSAYTYVPWFYFMHDTCRISKWN